MIGKKFTFIKSATGIRDFPQIELPHLAFAGRSNVGKSSLINKLANTKKLAKVSQTPGKTRLLNIFNVDDRFLLVDLPGYGYAKVSKEMQKQWKKMIEEYLIATRDIMILVFLIDSRHEPQKKDRELYEFLVYNDIEFIIAATKTDKLSKNQLKKNLAVLKREFKVPDYRFYPVSSKTGEGIKELENYLKLTIDNFYKE